MSEFVVQAGVPAARIELDPTDSTLSEAMQTVFPLATEAAILFWKNTCIPLSYKYDMSVMMADVLVMLWSITSAPVGRWAVTWPSSTFMATWEVEWAGGLVSITSNWQRVAGDVESVLNAKPVVSAAVDEFVAEWRRPLEIVETGLRRAGYTEDALPDLALLRRVLSRLPRLGVLYADATR